MQRVARHRLGLLVLQHGLEHGLRTGRANYRQLPADRILGAERRLALQDLQHFLFSVGRSLVRGSGDADLAFEPPHLAAILPKVELVIAASAVSKLAGAARARGRIGVEIAERVLDARQEHRQHPRVPEHVRVVSETRVEDPPLAVLPNPGDGVVVVVAQALAEASPLHHVGQDWIDAQEHPHLVAGIRCRKTIELVDVFEGLAVEGAGDGMGRLFDVDGGFLRRFAVRSTGCTENLAELGPVRRGDAGAVITDDAAAVGDEGGQRGAHLGRVEDITDGVVEIHRIVLLQICRGDGVGFARQRRNEGTGLLPHQLRREVAVRNRGVAAVLPAVVNPLSVEDEELPRLLRATPGLSPAAPPRSWPGPRARPRGADAAPAGGLQRVWLAVPAQAERCDARERPAQRERTTWASYRVAPRRPNGAGEHAVGLLVVDESLRFRVPAQLALQLHRDVGLLAHGLGVNRGGDRRDRLRFFPDGVEEVLLVIVGEDDALLARPDDGLGQRCRLGPDALAAHPDPTLRPGDQAGHAARLELLGPLLRRDEIHVDHADTVGVLLLDRPRVRHVADVLVIARPAFDLDRCRLVGVEEELRGVEIVNAPGPAETAEAVIADEQPRERDAHVAVWHVRGGAEPHVVVEAWRWILQRLGCLRLGWDASGRSDHDVADIADVAVPDQLRRVAVVVARSLLRAPLKNDPVFLDRLAQGEAFCERDAQRLFTIDVLAAAGRLDAHERVPSFTRRDDDRVDVLPGQQLAKIGEAQAGLVAIVEIDSRLELLERFLADVADARTRTSGIFMNPRTWPPPILPTPMCPSWMRSLGGVACDPAMTCRGTIIGATAAAVAARRKSRRFRQRGVGGNFGILPPNRTRALA